MKNREFAKKRMMFIPKEDYNYLIYNILLILNDLNCINERMSFSDFRRIAYILDFMGSHKAIDTYTQEELGSIYVKSQIKIKILSHVLIILKNNDYIGISVNPRHQTFDIWLKKKNISTIFWDNNIFELELSQLNQIKRIVPKFRQGTIKTLAQKLYGDKNVLIWEI